jgi:metal-responsive CopG/Arc/MetJ family transcriptional regulator
MEKCLHVSITVPERLLALFDEAVAATGESRSTCIREAIRIYLKLKSPNPDTRPDK